MKKAFPIFLSCIIEGGGGTAFNWSGVHVTPILQDKEEKKLDFYQNVDPRFSKLPPPQSSKVHIF